jgi:maleate cis-trans isomerase
MKKFGVIAPSIVQLPWDLQTLLPDTVRANVATLSVRNGRPGEVERGISILRGATDVLIDEGAEAIVVQGVPVSAKRGYAGEKAGLEALTADRGAVPITSSLAVTALALQHLGSRHPLLITQYNDETNELILDFYRAMGLEPVGACGLGATNAAQVNALTASDFESLARTALSRHARADGIFLSGRGNLFEVTEGLTRSLGLPSVEQIQSTVWWSLRQLGEQPIAGKGCLFQ